MIFSIILLQATSGQGSYMSLLPLLLVFVVFYFFMIRPQMRKQKELKAYRDALKKGDKVITTGGMYGKITEISDLTINIEIAPNVSVKVDKFAILKDPSDLAAQKQ